MLEIEEKNEIEDFSNNNNAPWIIIGLGNPGSKYNNTRHNIGWAILDKINKNHNVSISKNNKDYYFSSISFKKFKYYTIYPATYINNSGDIVKKIVKNLIQKKLS